MRVSLGLFGCLSEREGFDWRGGLKYKRCDVLCGNGRIKLPT